MVDYVSLFFMIATALTWGITNPFIKRASTLSLSQPTNKPKTFFSNLYNLLTSWRYILVQLINWSGSVLFLFALGKTDITIAVPVTNSLTFVVTELTDTWILKAQERKNKTGLYVGIALVLIGIAICQQA
jgi:multidrug transporter EmrE-like cation transporter